MLERSVETPFGQLGVQSVDGEIIGLRWFGTTTGHPDETLMQATQQLTEYAQGLRQDFDLPLRLSGPPLVQAVARAMLAIPFGETRTYGDIAREVGASAQAVGQACGANPIPILVPCHRVMGANGKLTGFSGAGGVETKVALLRHEGAGSFLL